MQEELQINIFKNEIEYKESITVDGLITLYNKGIFTNIICDADKQTICFDEKEIENFQKTLEMILKPIWNIFDGITKKVALALEELGENYNDYIANLGRIKREKTMIEIGEYIRTKKGEIMKVTSIPVEVDGKVTYQTDKGWVELECDIVNHSKKIVDLIDDGDYINEQRAYINWESNPYIFEDPFNEETREFKNDKRIRTILTHEQYKQNCYRLEG